MVNTIFILNQGYRTSRILSANKNSQKAFWDDLYTQEFDTGAETFEFSCYASEEVVEGNYVIFYYNNQYKMFTIMDIEEEHKKGKLVTHCYCEISALSLLNNHVRAFKGDMNCIQFYEHILQDTGWVIGKYSESLKDKVETINVSKTETVWGLIEDYKDIYECELNVRVTYENGYITGRYIDIYSDGGLGTPTYKRFEYGRNVTGIVKQKDLYDWCTAIIVDAECNVNDTIIESADGHGFTKSAGDVIYDDNANRMYNAGRNYVVGVYSGKETEPVEACINAWKQLQKRKEPKFDYKVTTALTDDEYEDIHLGDTVHVVDYGYTPPLFLQARVGKLELSFTDKTQNSCTLTNYKEIKSKLLSPEYTGLTGTITDIVNTFFPITSEGIADGAITDGKIDTVYYQQITADIISAGIGVFEDLYAKNMTVINADIENLKANNAEIDNLKTKYAEIDTLVNGHLTSDNIHSMIITGDKFTVADAFIKDAMIDTVNAGKVNAGRLNTSLVSIGSEDGSLTLNGSLQQFKDSNNKVRIQIGKDAQGNFTFCLFSQDGVGVLIDETGIKEGAIGDGLIVDDMVADDANIDGGKLDISSVIMQINNNSTLINSSKIFLDGENQSLEVAFDQLKTKVETIEDVTVDGDLSSVIEQITSNTTNINIMQGQISGLISNTTITKENGQVVQLKDEYNSLKSTVDSNTSKIGSLTTTVDGVSSNQATLEQNLSGFKSTVSSTYATKTQLNTTNSNVTTAQNTANSAKTKADTNATNITTISNKQSSLEQSLDKFKTTVSSTYATKAELENGALGANYVTKTEFEQTNEDFTFKISQTGGGNLLRNSSFYDADLKKWDYWTFWGNCSQYTDVMLLYESFPNSMIIKNTTYSGQGGLYQSNISVQPNTVYTCSANISWGNDVREVHMGVEYYNSSLAMIGSTVLRSTNSTLKNTTERQSVTFTTPTNCSYVTVTFNHFGVSSTSSPFLIIQRPCLVEGHSAVWVPHSDELYDGIVKIDKDGFTVKQGTSKSVLDSEALKFYEGSTLYSKMENGQLTYTKDSGAKVGVMGRNQWKEDNNIWVSHIGAEYQCDITIGAKSSSGQDHYPTNFVIAGGHHDVGTTGVYYNGVNIVYPTMASIVKFRPNTASYMDWDSTKEAYRGDGEIFGWRDSNSLKCLGVSGRNKLILGTHPGSTNYEIFSIYTNSSGSNYIDAYAPLNMHGYSVANLTARNSLSARSTYSSTLMDSGTNEYLTHNSMSYGEGEVRWCWRETVFTYAECDVDPVTDEWIYTGRNICYIELPIFMAENIQNDYHINVSKMSWGDYRIIEKTPYYFILESREEDFAFTFEVVAKLIDGETTDSNAIVANGGMYEFSAVEEQEGARVYLDDIQENIITGEE